jgi:hypothetical protein
VAITPARAIAPFAEDYGKFVLNKAGRRDVGQLENFRLLALLFCPLGQTMGTPNQLLIDSSHCRAICNEIGDRLRIMLEREATALPWRLQVLMLRLAVQDLARSPSIVPSVDDMTWGESTDTVIRPIAAAKAFEVR